MTCYVYDGSYHGFLSAVFAAYLKTESTISGQDRMEGPSLFDTVPVPTDEKKAARVTKGMRRLSVQLPRTVYSAWLSELPEVDDAILAALRLGFSAGRDPMLMRYDPQVKRVAASAQKVGSEAHRFLQFVRFTDVSGIFIADIEPLYDILPLIANHFHQRFGAQKVLIRDLRRRRAVVSGADGWYLAELSPEQCQPVSGNGVFEQMWRRYFAAIANKARYNPKLQQQFVPLRYREHLTEFQTPAQPGQPRLKG